ncbi:MAG: hypothetical protein HYU36_20730 [Planctomycetes bacterium]|nr:hypothetical protein [Planctomycetota bacterium]
MVNFDSRAFTIKGLSEDWRLAIAYNAALQCATAALAASGYRASREAHHFRIVQSLGHTLVVENHLASKLDAFRTKRNASDCERAGAISAAEADEMVSLARSLRERVGTGLRQNHPNLASK